LNTGRWRLNGWHRLWIAVALLGLIPAFAAVVAGWESADAWLADAARGAPIRVDVAGVGEVDFPPTMSREAIALVAGASHGSPDALAAGTRAWGAEFAGVLERYARAMNRALVLRVLGWWAFAVALVYVVGWLAAWVWRGFRA
jgi:hypothetical protein